VPARPGSVSVTIGGQTYRLRSEGERGEAERLHRVASHVDATMARIRERTGTVDTRDLAVLTALNLARELVALRERPASAPTGAEAERLRRLVALAESALEAGDPGDR